MEADDEVESPKQPKPEIASKLSLPSGTRSRLGSVQKNRKNSEIKVAAEQENSSPLHNNAGVGKPTEVSMKGRKGSQFSSRRLTVPGLKIADIEEESVNEVSDAEDSPSAHRVPSRVPSQMGSEFFPMKGPKSVISQEDEAERKEEKVYEIDSARYYRTWWDKRVRYYI